MLIKKFIIKVFNKVCQLLIKQSGAKIEGNFFCSSYFLKGKAKNFSSGSFLYVEKGALFSLKDDGKLRIGSYFYINHYSIIDCNYNITIGNRVQIGPHCYITDFDHDLVVDLNRAFHRGAKKFASVVIEDNVWIGAGVIILKGVRIGKNAVIGAGSVVKHDIPSNAVAVGNPARVIKIVNYGTAQENI